MEVTITECYKPLHPEPEKAYSLEPESPTRTLCHYIDNLYTFVEIAGCLLEGYSAGKYFSAAEPATADKQEQTDQGLAAKPKPLSSLSSNEPSKESLCEPSHSDP